MEDAPTTHTDVSNLLTIFLCMFTTASSFTMSFDQDILFLRTQSFSDLARKVHSRQKASKLNCSKSVPALDCGNIGCDDHCPPPLRHVNSLATIDFRSSTAVSEADSVGIPATSDSDSVQDVFELNSYQTITANRVPKKRLKKSVKTRRAPLPPSFVNKGEFEIEVAKGDSNDTLKSSGISSNLSSTSHRSSLSQSSNYSGSIQTSTHSSALPKESVSNSSELSIPFQSETKCTSINLCATASSCLEVKSSEEPGTCLSTVL